jgi:hypothetical protein
MTGTIPMLEVDDLDNIDKAELSGWLVPPKPATRLNDDAHGDLGASAAVVIVSLAAIKALALVLTRKKHHSLIRKTEEHTDQDGIRRTTVTEIYIAAEWSEAEVVKALGDATGIDTETLIGGPD